MTTIATERLDELERLTDEAAFIYMVGRMVTPEEVVRGVQARDRFREAMTPAVVADLIAAARRAEALEKAVLTAHEWAHTYVGSPDYPDRCRTCGEVGSYIHTEPDIVREVRAALAGEGAPR